MKHTRRDYGAFLAAMFMMIAASFAGCAIAMVAFSLFMKIVGAL